MKKLLCALLVINSSMLIAMDAGATDQNGEENEFLVLMSVMPYRTLLDKQIERNTYYDRQEKEYAIEKAAIDAEKNAAKAARDAEVDARGFWRGLVASKIDFDAQFKPKYDALDAKYKSVRDEKAALEKLVHDKFEEERAVEERRAPDAKLEKLN